MCLIQSMKIEFRKLARLKQRTLYIWKFIYSSARELFLTTWGQFSKRPCHQASVTLGATSYQMKDMNIIFLLIY